MEGINPFFAKKLVFGLDGVKIEFWADLEGFLLPFFAKKSDFRLDGVKIYFLADLGEFSPFFLPKNLILA